MLREYAVCGAHHAMSLQGPAGRRDRPDAAWRSGPAPDRHLWAAALSFTARNSTALLRCAALAGGATDTHERWEFRWELVLDGIGFEGSGRRW